jgi:GrpB-like predicted nucleotidyltransferase (UPF0157 family)
MRKRGVRMTKKPESGRQIGLVGGVEKRAIEIVPYRPAWRVQYQNHARRILNALGVTARRIEHIGSTSVEGLAAKPIIDMLVVVLDASNEELYLPAMLAAGYEIRVREPDFEEHRMFRTPERDVHIHVFPEGAGEIHKYLLFRDFLRQDPEARAQYEALKYDLATRDWADMNEYADAKTTLVEDIIRRARNK